MPNSEVELKLGLLKVILEFLVSLAVFKAYWKLFQLFSELIAIILIFYLFLLLICLTNFSV